MDNTPNQPNPEQPSTPVEPTVASPAPSTEATTPVQTPSPTDVGTPPTTTQTSTTPATPPPAEKKKLSKPVLFAVILVFLALLGVGAYLMMQKPAAAPMQVATHPTAAPTVTMSPEEVEVNNIDTGATESSDLNDVQNDINSVTTPSPSTTK